MKKQLLILCFLFRTSYRGAVLLLGLKSRVPNTSGYADIVLTNARYEGPGTTKTPANGMVIGEDLYQLVKSRGGFRFESAKEQSDNKYSQYPAYIVQTKEKRNILNPFKRVPESKKEG